MPHVCLRSVLLHFAVFSLSLGLGFAQQEPTVTTPADASQDVTPMAQTPVYRVQVVGRTTRAVNYRHRATTSVDFQGTKLDPNGKGKAKIASSTGRLKIDVEMENLPKPSIYGPEYLTYVLWAITPEGRAANLGEIIPRKDGKAELSVTTDLQAFGLILTAEPYFAVTIPSDQVILENLIKSDTKGWEQPIEAKFDVLQRGEYTVEVSPGQLASQTADEKMPTDLKEAINAVAIAKAAGAQQYAAETLAKAEDFLARAQDYYARKQGDKAIGTVACGAVQSAEDARLLTIRRKREEERIAQQRRAEQAEQDRQAAVQQRVTAIQLQQQAESDRAKAEEARRQAEQAQREAEQARAEALAQKQAAQADSEKARQDAQRAEQDKEQTRARLMAQLNQVLETRESARGLIVSMPDVLFDFNRYTLKSEARERLAKVSGILMAYPGLNVKVEGHTDNIGSLDYNQKLSDQRAETVRGFMVSQGVAPDIITAQGFGMNQPVAPNDTAGGRSKNRRVELVVNGSAIGDQAGAAGSATGGDDPSAPSRSLPSQPGTSSPASVGTTTPQR
jgi:outer membrane protein OmpA-like peptidoglycan-associated protein